jgi:electron-transferring-flavoprotein dehydrogenase
VPSYGEVHGEAVYLLTKGAALRIPPPPTMRNHGNWVVSVSQLARFLAEQAEAGGAAVLPETDAQKLLVADGRVQGIRTGDKGLGRDGNTDADVRAGLGHRREADRPRRRDAGATSPAPRSRASASKGSGHRSGRSV